LILLDANILLYAYDRASERHEAAADWLETALSGAEPAGVSWSVVLAFLRITTSPRMLREPLSMAEAISVVSQWLERPNVRVVDPGERHWRILGSLLVESQVRGADVMDAHLAALALEHGATVCTHDRDFARFPGLRMLDPLER
jgi:toxin-antitoxin system PIN domain toxin